MIPTKIFLERNADFSVDTAISAKEAISMLMERRYDAIISDFQMPEMNGIEFLKKIRRSGNTIPFIIFTGKGREEVVIQALNEGADFYLQKGGEPKAQFAELVHKVRQSVQQRRAEISIRDLERRQADILNFLPDATFAIDTNGVVIAWNRAMEMMTGIRAAEMLGKGDYEYALPFYRERCPILIDLVLRDDPAATTKYPNVIRDQKNLIAEVTIPHFNNGKGASIWFIASPLYDTQGAIIGAIESIRDVTAKKEMEISLKESEERFRTLADAAMEGIMIHDRGMIVDCNPQFASLFGYNPEEIIGRNGYEFMLTAESIDAISRWRQNGSKGTFDIIGIKKDGTRFYGETASTTILWRGKQHSIVELYDITERKRAEEALQTAKEFAEKLIQTANTMIIGLDTHGTITILNRAAQEITGYNLTDLVGRNWFEVIVPRDRYPQVWEEFTRLMNGGLPKDFENPILTKNGEERYIVWNNAEIVENGQIVGTISFGIDITERKLAEEALRESEQRYRNVIEDQTEFISRFLPDGTHVFVNEAYCRYFGLKRDEILGHRFQPKIPARDQERVSRFFKSLTPDNPVDMIEHRIIMPDGEIRWQRWSDRAIFNAAGKIVEFQSVGRDITENKRSAEALKEANKKLHLLSEITRHDIRNKLTSLMTLLDLARDESGKPEMQEFFDRLISIAKTINEQIEFTKDYQELGILEPRWSNVHKLVQTAASGVGLGKIRLSHNHDNIEIFADPLLEKVFYNLIDNAVKHGDTITRISISSEEVPEGCRIIIEDNGVGIEQSNKEKIFQRGFGMTTGLGLFLTREILAITGITIHETGECGKGARFEILVPKGKYRSLKN